MTAVLVVRKFDNFSRILAEQGFSVINCPTIETVALEDQGELDAKLAAPVAYDGIFLTSRAAADVFRRRLSTGERSFAGTVYVLGRRSFEVLRNEDLDLFFDENANTAEEMLASIPVERLRDKRLLFVRGEQSLRVVPDFLNRIATVDEAVVYRTVPVTVDAAEKQEIRTAAAGGEILCACFFSPSGVESFLRQFSGEIFHQIKTAVIGKTTAEFLARQNLRVDFVSPQASAESFAGALIDYLKEPKF